MSKTEIAVSEGRTIYLKSVTNAPILPTKSTGLRVLKSASLNSKLSGGNSDARIVKGPDGFRGRKLYQLTLVERTTCPSTCEQWANCYGNKMPFASRYSPGVELEEALEADIKFLSNKHPEGFVVRLHVLGDFYSTGYVNFWRKQLRLNPRLRVYGYTHRKHGTQIGDAVASMVKDFPGRVAIRRSDGNSPKDPLPKATTTEEGVVVVGAVTCPEQTGKSESCLTCGLCFNVKTNIQFLTH